MLLSAQKAGNAGEHLDEEFEKLLPRIRTEATIGVDLLIGERTRRVIAELASLSPSPFCADWVKPCQTRKCKDSCRVFKISETEAVKKQHR